jgi:hypothetical protein
MAYDDNGEARYALQYPGLMETLTPTPTPQSGALFNVMPRGDISSGQMQESVSAEEHGAVDKAHAPAHSQAVGDRARPLQTVNIYN